MPTADFYISKNDALPVISATLENADNSIVDLTGGTVQLIAINADTGATTTASGTTGGVTGVVTATFPTTAAGIFRCKWLVTFGGTNTESFPNNDYFLVQVYDVAVQPGQILTSRADLDSIISTLGVTLNDFSYDDAQSIAFLQSAEAFIITRLSAQAGYGTTVPNVTQIMAGTGTAIPADKVFLKAAVVNRIAYLFGPGETNSVDVSQSVGPVSRDLGGIGETWIHQMEEYLIQCDLNLSSITGFKKWRVLV